MKLFENGVGRPTNEIKKKRRLFIAGISLAVVGLIGLGSFLTINATKQNIEVNTKGLKAEATTLDTKLVDLDSDGKITRNDLVKLKERLKSVYPYSMPGDVNRDKVVNIIDQLSIINYLERYDYETSSSSFYNSLMDVNGDKSINGKDLLMFYTIINKTKKDNVTLSYPFGDLNKDYKVNDIDFILLMRYLDEKEKIDSKTINGESLKVNVYGNNDGNYGVNTKTGSYWGNKGINIYAQRKITQSVGRIANLGDLSKYSRITIYYQLASDGKDMKSSYGFYMNDEKRYLKDVTLTTNKEGTTKWSSVQKAQFGLYREVGTANVLSVYLNHGTNKSANTAIIKIVKIVLE